MAILDNELPWSFLGDIDLQGSLFPELPDLTNNNGLALSPLDRWNNSPLEIEAVESSDIVNSIRPNNSQNNSQGTCHMGTEFSRDIFITTPSSTVSPLNIISWRLTQPDLVPRAAERHRPTVSGSTSRAPSGGFMREYRHGVDADANIRSHLCLVIVRDHQEGFTSAPFAQTLSSQKVIG